MKDIEMKLKKRYILLISFIVLTIAFCRKPFNPAVVSSGTGVVVIDGYISGGADSTYITVSKTVTIDGKASSITEEHAAVTIEDDQNKSYTLNELSTPGRYAIAAIGLNDARKYRVRVKLLDGSTYLSDLVPVKNSPPIDSVGYTIGNTGIGVYVNTHDPADKTHYYRWQYEETWRFHSYYNSLFMSDGKNIVRRPIDKQIYYCYAGDISQSVILQSSLKLTHDVIYQQPLTLVPPESEKIGIRYSILVKQYALTDVEYAFWQNMKTNTQDLGSIFDAQPSATPGNIHCITDPAKQVIGFIGAGTIARKRIFVDKSELPAWYIDYPKSCTYLDTALFINPITKVNEVVNKLILPPVLRIPVVECFSTTTQPVVIGYYCALNECVDCTLRGHTATPPFWK